MQSVLPRHTVAVLLTVLWAVPVARAIKPAHEGPSVEATLRYLNEQLHTNPNFQNLSCSNRATVDLSSDRQEIIITYRLINKKGGVREGLPPQFIYRIPVASVETAYIYGPRTVNDRVVIVTYGKAVVKIGPMWDCFRNKPKELAKQRFYNNAHLVVYQADDKRLYGIADAFKHLVKVLKTEPPPKASPTPESAAQPVTDDRPRLTQPEAEGARQ